MALDINEPTDQRLVSELPSYIRALNEAVNQVETEGSSITVSTLNVTAGDTALVVGTDLSVMKLETILIAGVGVSVIEYIRGGVEGQIKIFVFTDNELSFKDGVKSDGHLYLNQLPALSTFDAQLNDTIALLNIGGNGADLFGYWKEIWRQTSVK